MKLQKYEFEGLFPFYNAYGLSAGSFHVFIIPDLLKITTHDPVYTA